MMTRVINRGDKTPVELFIASVRGWEAALRQRVGNSNHNIGK
jgi:hypothetical protein